MRARRSRRWTGMPHDRKHERATCLLRCGDSSENSKAGSHRKRRVAAALQRPLHRGRRPNHRQAKGYLPRLLKIDAFRPCPGVAGPLSRDRRVAALLGASAGTSPVALAEPDLESRASTDPPLAALPTGSLNLIAPPQTDNCRGIALSGFNTAPPALFGLGALSALGSLV